MGRTVAVYRRLLGLGEAELAAAGDVVAGVLAARWPDLLDELSGLAAGAGQPLGVLLAVNARTELLAAVDARAEGSRRAAGGGECSLIGEVRGGRCRVAQNWDWQPDLRGSLVRWTVRAPERDRWFCTVTEAGMLAKLGVSSAGLCVGLNFLSSSLDTGVGGVPVHVLLRVLLDRCMTPVDALRVLREADMRSSACVTVGWADGDEAMLVAAELSPAGCGLVWPGADGRLVHTNHFLAGVPGGEDLEPDSSPSTLLRAWRLARAAPDEPVEAALCSHLGAPEAICRHEDGAVEWAERRASLCSVVMEAGPAVTLRVADGPPCEVPWEAVALP